MLDIVQAPNLVLSQKAKPINKVDKSIQHLIKQMEVTLDHTKDPEGVGLAAPQIGKSLQLFIIRQSPRSPLLTFINPVIEEFIDAAPNEKAPVKQSKKIAKAKKNLASTKEGLADQSGKHAGERNVQLEGCLSLYSIWGVVNRHYGVVLSYQDETGAHHKKKFDGFLATIIQHEFDHLQGILFPKRVLEQENQLYKAKTDAKGEVEFEEIEL